MTPVGVAEIDPGEGNLNLKAYIAAVLGPRRVAHGTSKQVKRLLEANSTKLVSANPASGQVGFISVSLVGSNPGPLIALFDSQQDVGQNSVPTVLSNTLGASAGVSFEGVLLPGDELYARSGVGVGTFDVVVSVNWF